MATSITWPVDLGQAVLIANSLTPQPNVVRSTVGVGPAITRKRSTKAQRKWSCTFIMKNVTEHDRFLQFLESDTNGGASSFNWKDPQTGVAAELRFESVGQIVHLGQNVFQVDFVLEKMF